MEYLARFLARLSFDQQITPRLANLTLGIAEQLSWTQYVMLGMFAQRDRRALPSFPIGEFRTWEAWGVHSELKDLIEVRGLVSAPPDQTERLGLRIPSSDFAKHRLTNGGSWMADCLGLDEMSSVAVAAVLTDLQRTPSPEAARD